MYEQTEMQKFVFGFINNRKQQDQIISGKRMMTFYGQTERYNRLSNFLCQTFTGSASMGKSEMLDFILFLLEGFLKGTYQNYETFDEYYAELESSGKIESFKMQLEENKKLNKKKRGRPRKLKLV